MTPSASLVVAPNAAALRARPTGLSLRRNLMLMDMNMEYREFIDIAQH